MPMISHQSSNRVNNSPIQLLTWTQNQNITLQRLTQQKKRMEYLVNVVLEQKQTIQNLKHENELINQKSIQFQVDAQLMQDKWKQTNQEIHSLNEVIGNQAVLIRSLKDILVQNSHISQMERQRLISQIENNWSHKLSELNCHNSQSELPSLYEQNQILSEKYQNLCADYYELVKKQKLREFELLNSNPQTSIANLNHVNIGNKDVSNISAKQKIRNLKLKIKNLETQISKRDILIQKHRENQDQQKRLLLAFKNKTKQQFKHHHQRVKSKDKQNQQLSSTKHQVTIQVHKSKKPKLQKAQNSNNQIDKCNKLTNTIIEVKENKSMEVKTAECLINQENHHTLKRESTKSHKKINI